MRVFFNCPVCEQRGCVDMPAHAPWQCPRCDQLVPILTTSATLDQCALCGNQQLYKKKDFPHRLGLTILAAACIGFLITNAIYWQWVGWTILIGSAAVDGVLYLTVKDAVVCYRCASHYRGVPSGLSHLPFDLGIAERYRQERIRREQIKFVGGSQNPSGKNP